MQTDIRFGSESLTLAGTLHVPDPPAARERRPALLVLHALGAHRASAASMEAARLFEQWGYAALRFDFRGCGESEGERGALLCMDEVEDARNALAYLGTRPEIDPARIGVFGHRLGAAVAVYAAGVDPRFAAVIASCGWGDGGRKLRAQHASPEAWARFTDMLEEGRRHRERTGEPLMVRRRDIAPVAQALRADLPPDAIDEFPVETAQSLFDFRPNDVIGRIAPRPLLLFHAANDTATLPEQTLGLFEHAGRPTDLVLLDDVEPFAFVDADPRATGVLAAWLARYFPVQG